MARAVLHCVRSICGPGLNLALERLGNGEMNLVFADVDEALDALVNIRQRVQAEVGGQTALPGGGVAKILLLSQN